MGKLIEAFAKLSQRDPELYLSLINAIYPEAISSDYFNLLSDQINALPTRQRVRLRGDFLPDKEAFRLLSECDLIVFPYEESGESASAAARHGIASGRPVATTPLPIFSDVKGTTFSTTAVDSEAFIPSLEELISMLRKGGDIVDNQALATRRWRQSHSFRSVAQRLYGMICVVCAEN